MNSTEPHKNTPSHFSQSAKVYEKYHPAVFGLYHWLLPESDAQQAMYLFASDLSHALKKNYFKKYSYILAFRVAYLVLIQHHLAIKIPISLPLGEAIALFFRDGLRLSCHDIAAIMNISEGSVRTRLERARAHLYVKTLSTDVTATYPHICINIQQAIEDWDPQLEPITISTLSQHLPLSIQQEAEICGKCSTALTQRLSSLQFFRSLIQNPVPINLQAFPVTPLFIKQGKKTLLNWNAAPWYIKMIFEGLLATAIVMGLVLSLPRIKSLYELWMEHHIDLYTLSELTTSFGKNPDHNETTLPDDRHSHTTNTEPSSNVSLQVKNKLQVTSEFYERDNSTASSNKIYRIMIKTVEPESLKPAIVKLLSNFQASFAQDTATQSVELPGGIMFDVYIPLKNYKALLSDLSTLGEPKVIITQSHAQIIPGKARIKIWLQRI